MSLTSRQQQVVDVIIALTAMNNRAPTIREICKAIGVSSPNGVTCHLRALRAKGVVQNSIDRHAGVRLVIHDRCPLCGSVP